MTLSPEPFLPAAEDLDEVRRLCREGLLQQLVGPVHLAAGVPVTATLRARALALLMPDGLLDGGAVVGFGSAAWVHAGWTPVGRSAELLDLVLPPEVRFRPVVPGIRLRQMRLTARHVTALGGLPVTTPARTVADLARDLPPARARSALLAVQQGIGRQSAPVDVQDVLRCLDEMPRARGCEQARLVVASWLVGATGPVTVSGKGQSSPRLPVIR